MKNVGSASNRENTSRQNLSKLLDSPLLFIFLLAGISVFITICYWLDKTVSLPNITSWSWTKHSNTLLVCYPKKDCGCGSRLSSMVLQGATNHLDVLLLTDHSNSDVSTLVSTFGRSSAISIKRTDEKTMNNLCPDGNIRAFRVQDGRVIYQSENASSHTLFEK